MSLASDLRRIGVANIAKENKNERIGEHFFIKNRDIWRI